MDRIPLQYGSVKPLLRIFLKKFFSESGKEIPFIRAMEKEITAESVNSKQGKRHKSGQRKQVTDRAVKRRKENYSKERKQQEGKSSHKRERKELYTLITEIDVNP